MVLRNLGLAAHDVDGDPEAARRWYDAALAADPASARLVYESDLLDVRRGRPLAQRLEALEAAGALATDRDDTAVALAHLLLSQGRLDDAHELLARRRFQPWEGGEGEVLAAWERLRLLQAQRALDGNADGAVDGEPGAAAGRTALEAVESALQPPVGLGEARHPLASTAALQLARGDALALLGDEAAARAAWEEAAASSGDFTAMATEAHSEATASRVTALRRLGRTGEADALTDALERFVAQLAAAPAVVDYFATSLPSLLLFSVDPEVEKARRVELLRAQVELLRGDDDAAALRLRHLLEQHPDHHRAVDLAARPHLGLDHRSGPAVVAPTRPTTGLLPPPPTHPSPAPAGERSTPFLVDDDASEMTR